MSYKLISGSTSILRLSDSACIPPESGNRDYIEFLEWRAAGGVPLPADPPPPPSADQLNEQVATQYAKLRALATMTQAEIDAWVVANVTNLAQAQDAIKTLAKAVSIILRRLFPEARN